MKVSLARSIQNKILSCCRRASLSSSSRPPFRPSNLPPPPPPLPPASPFLTPTSFLHFTIYCSTHHTSPSTPSPPSKFSHSPSPHIPNPIPTPLPPSLLHHRPYLPPPQTSGLESATCAAWIHGSAPSAALHESDCTSQRMLSARARATSRVVYGRG